MHLITSTYSTWLKCWKLKLNLFLAPSGVQGVCIIILLSLVSVYLLQNAFHHLSSFLIPIPFMFLKFSPKLSLFFMHCKRSYKKNTASDVQSFICLVLLDFNLHSEDTNEVYVVYKQKYALYF